MDLLHAGDPLDDDALLRLYAHPAPSTGWVRANFVSTLDGSAVGADGRSGSINDAADRRVFDLLRALADVVLVGAGTARDERYTPLAVAEHLTDRRAGLGLREHLELAVVTASGDVPARLLEADRPPLVVTHAGCERLDELRARVGHGRLLVQGAGEVDLAGAVRSLAAHGLPHVLTEGGPTLFAGLLAAGVVDELCLTTSPQLVGGPGLRITEREAWLSPPRGARLAHAVRAGDTLLTRWLLGADG